jgi:hypothetical protein
VEVIRHPMILAVTEHHDGVELVAVTVEGGLLVDHFRRHGLARLHLGIQEQTGEGELTRL